jgi:hypothetical protein
MGKLKKVCEYRERTAGPSTTLRSGRDDNSLRGIKYFFAEAPTVTTELSSRPERSVVEGPAVLSLALTHPRKPWVAIFLIFFVVSTVHGGTDFDQRLAEARRLYFANPPARPGRNAQKRLRSE